MVVVVTVQDLATQWIQRSPLKTKTLEEATRSLHKFKQFTGIWKSLCRSAVASLYVNITSIRNKTASQKEECAEGKKVHPRYFCSSGWMQNGGLLPRNATVICETFKTFIGRENPLRITFFGEPLRVTEGVNSVTLRTSHFRACTFCLWLKS